MPIWFQPYTLESVQKRGIGTMVEHIGIEITSLGDDYLSGTMPVDHRTIQPMGLLHGGASVVLAETLGSIAANLVVNPATHYCVGLDINANHLRPVTAGKVIGTAKALHLGKTTQVWSIEIKNEEDKLCCISRLTMAVVEKRPA
jgi:1,4-dihydroxy-2-naphthoyl-CoA hydrolase